MDVTREDLMNFAREHDLAPTFTRARGSIGYIELETVEKKEEAIQKLDGQELVVREADGSVRKSYRIRARAAFEDSETAGNDRYAKRPRMGESAVGADE